MTELTPGRFEFGDFEIDVQRRRLTARRQADPIALPPRVFDTLAFLIEHPGRLVAKRDLLRAIWPNAFADDNSLNQNISLLRRALGERPGDHRYIITVPGRGYRFVADVRPLDSGHPEDPPAASVAVLRFANLTGMPSEEYLGEGLAEELIHQLSNLRGVTVAARSSSFAIGTQPGDLRQVASALGVRTVLEGSVRRIGTRIRASIQLIECESGYTLCSRTVERPPEHLFHLEDELLLAIAGALGVRAEPVGHSTAHVEAHHLFMQARALSTLPSEDNLRGALEYLKRATDRDPGFARAWSLMAATLSVCVEYDYAVPDAIGRAEKAARRSVMLDPEDGAGLAAIGIIDALRGRWVESEGSFRAATLRRVDPYINNLRCVYLTQAAGHLNQALEEARTACMFAVAQQFGATMMALTQLLRGDDAGAREWIEVSAGLGESVTMTPQADVRALLAHRAACHDEAAKLLIRSTPEHVRAAGADGAINALCAALGGEADPGRAVQALKAMEQRVAPLRFDQTRRKRLMLWYTMLGDLDAAYDVLHRSLDHHGNQGFVGSVWGWLWLPELRPLRADPRFQAFVSRIGLVPYWEQFGPPDGHELRRGLLVSC